MRTVLTILIGHVFPGASLPFGMAKAVADVDKETQGGFASNDGLSTLICLIQQYLTIFRI